MSNRLVYWIGVEVFVAVGVVEGVVKSTTFSTFLCHFYDEVADVDFVAEFANGKVDTAALVEALGFATDYFETVESTLESEVATHDANVVAHYGLDFVVGLRNED